MDLQNKLKLIKRLVEEIEAEMYGTPQPKKERLYNEVSPMPVEMAQKVVTILAANGFVGRLANGTDIAIELTHAGVNMEDYIPYVKNFGGTDPVRAGKLMVALSKMDLRGYNIHVKPRDGKNYYVLREN